MVTNLAKYELTVRSEEYHQAIATPIQYPLLGMSALTRAEWHMMFQAKEKPVPAANIITPW